jgi:two-component system, chemotaxis family, CheB/CheR fusion protein
MPTPLRVLLVDDDKDTVLTLAMLVRLWGHEAQTACNGNDALELAKSFRPDVVLLDMGMPDKDGAMLSEELLALSELGNVRIVAISGHADLQTQIRAEDAGVHQFLVKPVKADALNKLLADYGAKRE